jgi:1-acyl-sn-glycerol-3-phosphate acyltransferase
VPRLASLRRGGRSEKLGLIWTIGWLALYAPVSLLFKNRTLHVERLPRYGPVIVVTNHVSHVDPFLVAKLIVDAGRLPRFLAKESLFAVPVVGAALRAMGHIPVRRGTTDARQSLAAAVDALHAGRLIVMHPEGTVTRDPDGWPMSGKTGIARLALLVPDAPVVPLAQWGVQDSIDLYHKKVRLFPRPQHAMSIGEPIDLSAWRGAEPTARTLAEITDHVMRQLRADVAELRGLPEPAGDLYHWVRP